MSNSRSNVPVPQALRYLGVRNMNITKLEHTTGPALTKLPPQIGDLKKLNNTKINNKTKTQNLRNNIRKRAGNAAQSRRTNVNNNNNR